MHALIPLLLIFLLFNRHQLNNDKLYRANVFALIGTGYFSFYQYTLYWFRTFPDQGPLQYIPPLIITFSTLIIALSPWAKKSHPLKTLFLCSIFAISVPMSYVFDHQIKEKLAEFGGYFSDATLYLDDLPATTPNPALQLPDIGLMIAVPAEWKIEHLPSGHVYFIYRRDNQIQLEARPNCLGEFAIDTPTFIRNTLLLLEANREEATSASRCTHKGDVKECLVKVKYKRDTAVKEKWRLLRIHSKRAWSVDILLFRNDQSAADAAATLIQSTEPLATSPTEPCHTPAAWL